MIEIASIGYIDLFGIEYIRIYTGQYMIGPFLLTIQRIFFYSDQSTTIKKSVLLCTNDRYHQNLCPSFINFLVNKNTWFK